MSSVPVILDGLDDEVVLRQQTKSALLERAREQGLSVEARATKADLVRRLSDPLHVLREADDIGIDWFIAADEKIICWATDSTGAYIVRSGGHGIEWSEAEASDRAEAFRSSLWAVGCSVIEVSFGALELDELSGLIDETHSDCGDHEIWTDIGLLVPWDGPEGPVWVPDDYREHADLVLRSSWDLVGRGDPSPATGNPGSNDVYRYRGFLLLTDGAGDLQEALPAPPSVQSGEELAAALGTEIEWYVNWQTYELSFGLDLEPADIAAFLSASSHSVGALLVDGEWWYETPNGWTNEVITRRAAPTGDEFTDTSISMTVGWIYPPNGRAFTVLPMEPHDTAVRLPLALVAAHKHDGTVRSGTGLVTIEDDLGGRWVGVAAELQAGEAVAELVGVDAWMEVDEAGGVRLHRASATGGDVEIALEENWEHPPAGYEDAIEALKDPRTIPASLEPWLSGPPGSGHAHPVSLRRLATALKGSGEDVDDVASAFLQLWRAARETGMPLAWLRAVTELVDAASDDPEKADLVGRFASAYADLAHSLTIEEAEKIVASADRLESADVRRVSNLLPGEIGYVFPNAIGRDRDDSLWLDLRASVRSRGLPAEDPIIRRLEDGRTEVDVSRLSSDVASRNPAKHVLRVTEADLT